MPLEPTPGPWKAEKMYGWQESYEPYEITGPNGEWVGVMEFSCNKQNDLPVILATQKTYSACKKAFELLDNHGTDDPAFVADGYIAFPEDLVDALYDELWEILKKVKRLPE